MLFDEADVIRRANDLADFVEAARRRPTTSAVPLALGYSNGANIAAAILLLRPRTLQGGILLRAMVPLAQPPEANLSGRSLLLVSGQHDPIIPPAQRRTAGRDVDQRRRGCHSRRILPAGHQLSQAEHQPRAREWLTRAEATADVKHAA